MGLNRPEPIAPTLKRRQSDVVFLWIAVLLHAGIRISAGVTNGVFLKICSAYGIEKPRQIRYIVSQARTSLYYRGQTTNGISSCQLTRKSKTNDANK